MDVHPRLLQELEAAESHLNHAHWSSACNRVRVALEIILKREISTELERAKGAKREALLARVPAGRTIQQLMVGELLRMLEGHPIRHNKKLDATLIRLNGIGNSGSHDSRKPPGPRQAFEALDDLWAVLAYLGAPEHGCRPLCRERARNELQHGRGAIEAPPPAILDRTEQRKMLMSDLGQALPLRTVLFHGELGQGHEVLSSVALNLARCGGQGCWKSVEPMRWPASIFPRAQREAELIEGIVARVEGPPGAVSFTDAVDAVRGLLARQGVNLFVRHTVTAPKGDDVALLERYLNELWLPAVASYSEPRLLLTFELQIPPAPTWRWLTASGRAAARAQRVTTSVLESCARFSSDQVLITCPPELRSLTVTEIEHFLPQRLRQLLSPGEPLEVARKIHQDSEGGRFDYVVQQLHNYMDNQ